MADTLTTTTQVDPAVATFYDRVLLKRAQPALVHELFAQKKKIPSGSGDTIKFRRYSALSVATTPLSEGVTPPGQQLSKTDLTAIVSFYGDFVTITDVVDLTNQDPVLTEAAEVLGEQMGQTRDAIIRDIMAACASATSASHGTNGGTPTELTSADLDVVVQALLGGNAKMILPQMLASTGQGTVPGRAAFVGIFMTDILDDLEVVDGFKSIAQYPMAPFNEHEWGSYKNIRFLMSSVAYKSSDATPQYWLPIIGQDAYGVSDLEGAAKNIVKGFGSGGGDLSGNGTL